VQEAIFTVVAAVLHLGNTTFTANPNDDNGCLLENETAKQHLIWAAELLGVSPQGLHKALTTKTIKTPEGPIVTPITAADADFNRNSLAKTIYARLFDYLVEQVRLC
jgi:myosin-5